MKAKIKPRISTETRTPLETIIPLNQPFTIYIDPSDKCNFGCKFCPTGDRKLMKVTPGRNFGLMDFALYQKIINGICEFDKPIKALWLYKDGEPLLHPRFADMVRYAKEKKCAEKISTTTNASLLSPKRNLEIIEAGLDRINISVYGVRPEQYMEFSKYKVNLDALMENIRHLYEHRKSCEIIIKINGDSLPEEDKQKFYEMFGDIADGVFIEHTMSCWPEFDLESRGTSANKEFGIYGQPIKEIRVCPYIFYGFSFNSDGTASACFLDWERKLIIGDAKTESVKDIWNGAKLLAHRQMMLRKERKQHPVCGNCGQMSHGMADDIDNHAEILLKKIQKN